MFRNLLRYTGLILILAIFLASGLQKVSSPAIGAALLAKSNFPQFLEAVGVELTPSQYVLVIQATGIIFLSFSLFILLGVGRSFFAFLLACGTLVITVSFHVDIHDPFNAPPEKQIAMMNSLAIAGGLFFVAGSGRRRPHYSQIRAAREADKKHQ